VKDGKFQFDWLNFVIGLFVGAVFVAVIGNL